MRYTFVQTHQARWRVERMCRLLNLSRSGFYAWRKRGLSKRAQSNESLTKEIREIYGEGRGEYGSPTIYNTLREKGFLVNHKRIESLMRAIGLRAKIHRRFKKTTVACKDG